MAPCPLKPVGLPLFPTGPENRLISTFICTAARHRVRALQTHGGRGTSESHLQYFGVFPVGGDQSTTASKLMETQTQVLLTPCSSLCFFFSSLLPSKIEWNLAELKGIT